PCRTPRIRARARARSTPAAPGRQRAHPRRRLYAAGPGRGPAAQGDTGGRVVARQLLPGRGRDPHRQAAPAAWLQPRVAAPAHGADRMFDVADRDPKGLILVVADMARSDPPMTAPFVAELARRLHGRSAALALPLTWVEQRLAENHQTIEDRVQLEAQHQAAEQVSVSNSIGSLRLLGST